MAEMLRVLTAQEKRERTNAKAREYRAAKVNVKTPQGLFRQVCSFCGDEFFAKDRNIRVCGEGACLKQKQRLQPFTVPHFKKWASGVILDTEKPWKIEPFQELFLEDLFAGIPECWLLIGEGNTKTTFLAGVGLYHCQWRRGGRVPVAASSRDQAEIMYLQMEGMVERSESLFPLFRCQEGLRRVKCDSMSSRVQIFSADDRTGDGIMFTLALIDELHRHRDLKLYRTWSGKRKKMNGQICAISTAGEPGSEFEQTRDLIRQSGRRVEERQGYVRVHTDTVAFHEYAVPAHANVEDMKVVKLANPFSAITQKSLREKRKSHTMTLSHWKRFTCNVATRGFDAAITELEWFGQRSKIEIPKGVPIWAGLDVAWKWDTLAVVPFWPQTEQFRLFGPSVVVETPRDGSSLDPAEAEDALWLVHNRNPIHTLVMDTTRAEQLASWAREHLGCEVVDRGQGNALQAQDYERFMEGLRSRFLWHAGDELLTRHALNAVAQSISGTEDKKKFARPKASRGGTELEARMRVIDALVAGAMVHSLYAAELEVEETNQVPLVGLV